MAEISQEVNIEILEKLSDGTYKKKNPATKAGVVKFEDGSTVEDHKSDYVLQVPYGVATGSANTYTITLNPAPTSYKEGMAIAVKINITNTGASTININGLGAKSIRKANGNNVSAGNLKAGSVYSMRYNGTNFILQGSDSAGNATPADVLSGKTFSNDAYTDLIGTMPSRTGHVTAQGLSRSGTTLRFRPQPGYYDGTTGNSVQRSDVNFVAGNILKGKSIFGLAGGLRVPGYFWERRPTNLPSDLSGSLRDVAYGNGLWVAVGLGKALTSSNGIAWTERNLPVSDRWWNSVDYGNGLWVIAGQQAIASSLNGVSWTLRSYPFSYPTFNAIKFVDGLWVVAGDIGELMTSTNGTSWTARNSGFGSSHIEDVAYGNGLWVACGGDGKISTSTNGTSWTARNSGISVSINSISFGQGKFIATIRNSSTLITSTDGVNWSSGGNCSISNLVCIRYCNGLWIASGTLRGLAISPDGVHWTTKSSEIDEDVNGISAALDSHVSMVLVGDSGAVYTSSY